MIKERNMEERDKLLNDIVYFMNDIYGLQKDLDLVVYAESLPQNVFKKKFYQDHIDEYRRLKDLALKIDTSSYEADPDDEELMELFVIFDETLALYNLYCERGIEVQDFLLKKAKKENILKSEYLAATRKQKSVAAAFSKCYNDLNVASVDYTMRMDNEV